MTSFCGAELLLLVYIKMEVGLSAHTKNAKNSIGLDVWVGENE